VEPAAQEQSPEFTPQKAHRQGGQPKCAVRARVRLMGFELLIIGLIGGGTIGGGLISQLYTKKLKKELKKQRYQLATIEELYKEVQRSSLRIDRNYLESIEAFVRALEARDMYTRGHSDRVHRYSVAIADELQLDEAQKIDIHHGSLLHDIGKIGVYDRILLKPQGLTQEEFEMMKAHPGFGADIFKNVSALQGVIPIILHHHERQDGSGYPLGLLGNEIPIGARIVQVADSWDAMTSDRPYRRRLSFDVAVSRLKEAQGSQLDENCVEAFLRWLYANRSKLKMA
jgi:HD-GYP domain-containing protein (c-di-GMP phosphodiesterase class II)